MILTNYTRFLQRKFPKGNSVIDITSGNCSEQRHFREKGPIYMKDVFKCVFSNAFGRKIELMQFFYDFVLKNFEKGPTRVSCRSRKARAKTMKNSAVNMEN